MRAGRRDCFYYVQHGWCRYGDGCRYDHPDWVQPRVRTEVVVSIGV